MAGRYEPTLHRSCSLVSGDDHDLRVLRCLCAGRNSTTTSVHRDLNPHSSEYNILNRSECGYRERVIE